MRDDDLRHANVLGLQLAYRELGSGDPIVLLHGNPTSSYLWRRVIPHLAPFGRVVAPDLLGMGRSEKLPSPGPGSYRFAEHRQYLDQLLDVLGVAQRVIWSGTIGAVPSPSIGHAAIPTRSAVSLTWRR